MKKILKLSMAIVVVLSIQGCQNMNKQGGGTLICGLAGGLLGSQFGKGSGQLLATGVGAIAGALVGNSIGSSMDEQDKILAEKNAHKALEYSHSGNRVEWKNPDNGNYGSVTPTKTFKKESRYCREYIQEVTIGGEKSKAYGQACRKPDGQWEII
ncbi:MAG: RT0821/Lpp0805 family surface protein [Rickettsiaceae bacterium]|nr:RT0821/Lpp0805 family surface protein [Rickettsiaceae bacterium]